MRTLVILPILIAALSVCLVQSTGKQGPKRKKEKSSAVLKRAVHLRWIKKKDEMFIQFVDQQCLSMQEYEVKSGWLRLQSWGLLPTCRTGLCLHGWKMPNRGVNEMNFDCSLSTRRVYSILRNGLDSLITASSYARILYVVEDAEHCSDCTQ